MLNETLKELYVNGVITVLPFNNITPRTILQELTNAGIKYTWETVRDERIDNIQSVIEVRVYLPSHILYGRHVYKTIDAFDAHLYAIANAIKLIVKNNVQEKSIPVKENIEYTQPQQTETGHTRTYQPLSQEQILNMVQEENKITTAEQFTNDPREEIPFDEVDLDIEELNKLVSGKTNSQNQQQTSHGFTQEQINAINEFKRNLGITDDISFGKYINAWNGKYTRKEDLNPSNIDSFIEWTKIAGKAPC